MTKLKCYVNGYVISELYLSPLSKYEERNKHSFIYRQWRPRFVQSTWINCFSTDLTSTGRFIMSFMITNIYNRKKFFFLTTRDVRCVHRGWHGTHRYDIQFVATHVSICWHVCEYRIDVCRVTRGAHIEHL